MTITLTPRERQALTLLANGLTNHEIAEKMSLSIATVAMHLKRARARLGARTREEAVAMAVARGLIEVAPLLKPPVDPASERS